MVQGKLYKNIEHREVIKVSTILKFPCGKIWNGISKAEDVDLNGGRVNVSAKLCSGCENFTYYGYKTHGFCTGVVYL